MCSCFLSLLIRFYVYQTQVYLFGIFITFVNSFHFNFNLVVMLVCFTFVSSVKKIFEATHFIIFIPQGFWMLRLSWATLSTLVSESDWLQRKVWPLQPGGDGLRDGQRIGTFFGNARNPYAGKKDKERDSGTCWSTQAKQKSLKWNIAYCNLYLT